jgi:hypothetical protein
MNRLKLMLVGMGFVIMCVLPLPASADVNDFVIHSFSSDQTLTRNDPQGELRITEKIDLTFSDNNHGILRAIPDRYKHHSLQLKVQRVDSASGAPSQFSTYKSNGNTVLKIGDPDRTVTGRQQYTIEYTLRNVITYYDDHDELYWDVNGDQWLQQFDRVSLTLHLPADLQVKQQPLCFTGDAGSQANDCVIDVSGGVINIATTKPLFTHQGLTYVAGFEKGYFQSSKWYETLAEYSKPILQFLLPVLVIGGTALRYWWVRGRDAKGTGIIVPQYDAPDNLKPLAVGTIIDFTADNRDITATIIDLAIRKYLKVIESKQDRLIRKDKLTYSLELVNSDWSNLDEHEKKLLYALFPVQTTGTTVDMSGIKDRPTMRRSLYSAATDLRTDLKKELTDGGYFRNNALSGSMTRNVVWGILIVFFFIPGSIIALGPGIIAGLVVGGLIAVACLIFIDARTAKGVAAKEHIEGLKMYLDVAEKDRLAKLQAPNAAYATTSTEPVKTVDLFEKLLPFAMVLGVEQQWAKQFEDLYKTPPDWYSGNWSSFNTGYLVGSINSGIGGAVNGAFAAPSSSSGSGFSGGGSGGGGGGGGGGGW